MIRLCRVTKRFDDFTAVDGIDLHIRAGEFFGLLGSNGAGKTTTINMLSTLLLPTQGEIYLDGEKLTRRRTDLKRKLSVVTQEFSMRQDMNMNEIMEYQGRLYNLPRKVIRQRTEELLDFAGLLSYRRRGIRKLSGGMKRKLMVCRALLTEPAVLLLDEPTAGMDALARRQMWDLLTRLKQQGLTILLTTHYMEEAQALCDRVAMMEKGRIEAVDTPAAFIRALGEYAIDTEGPEGRRTVCFATRDEALRYAESLTQRGVASLQLRSTVLEDVFLQRVKGRTEGGL